MRRFLELAGVVWALVACGQDPVPVEWIAELEVNPGATAVAVVPGAAGSTIVAVANGPRGVLDVFVARAPAGPWELFGSAFAGSRPSVLVPGEVAGVGVLFVLATSEVQMIEVDPVEPGRLSFPVPILRDGGKTTIDAGDLDGDGDDELVAGGRGGIRFVGGLTAAIGVVPSRVPPLDRRTLRGHHATAAVAVSDGSARVASAAFGEPLVRIEPTAEQDATEPESHPLPDVAAELVATDGGGFVALLDDGRLLDIAGAGEPFAAEIARIAPADGGVIAARQNGSIAWGDASTGLADLGLRFDEIPLLAVGEGLLAAVEPTAGLLHLFRVRP
jgi:hypothetical protein